MKKKILIGMLVVSITIITAFNLNLNIYSTDFAYSTLSLANLDALAQNNNEGEKGNSFSTIECITIVVIDPTTQKIVGTSESAQCSGDGTKECKCP